MHDKLLKSTGDTLLFEGFTSVSFSPQNFTLVCPFSPLSSTKHSVKRNQASLIPKRVHSRIYSLAIKLCLISQRASFIFTPIAIKLCLIQTSTLWKWPTTNFVLESAEYHRCKQTRDTRWKVCRLDQVTGKAAKDCVEMWAEGCQRVNITNTLQLTTLRNFTAQYEWASHSRTRKLLLPNNHGRVLRATEQILR